MDETELVTADLRGRILIGVGIGLAVSVSMIIGYVIAEKKLEKKFQKLLEEEIEDTKKFYSTLTKRTMPTPQDALESLHENGHLIVVEDLVGSLEYVSGGEGMVEVVTNVFTNAENWDLEEELKTRDPDRPYILEHDEFFNSEFQDARVTYYEGDGVLVDERDEHIPDIDGTVGEDNLLRFGHGSRDNNILYIRNEKLDIDFEVVRDQGKYTEKILGYVQHDDDMRRHRRFRATDE